MQAFDTFMIGWLTATSIWFTLYYLFLKDRKPSEQEEKGDN